MNSNLVQLRASEQIKNLIREDVALFCRITRTSPDQVLPVVLDAARYEAFFTELEHYCGPLDGRRVLEIGAGYGMMLTHCVVNHQTDIYGVEPPKQDFEGRFEIARQILAENNVDLNRIQPAIGEQLPFLDETFDVVFSFEVLEHVRDPFRVLAESWRVLKPGGVLYCSAPNYRTFFEGHYNIPWPPGLPKALAPFYLRLLGFDPSYIHHINFITEPQLRRWLTQICGAPITSDFGMGAWLAKMKRPVFSPYTDYRIVRYVRFAQRIGLLRLIALIGRYLRSQDVLCVAVRKP
jgi:2-polyprenyl-3-methyl-5-hydroxy-6-metoxy-1,4-benzoquinol methylase